MQQNLKFPAQCTVIPAEELEQISGGAPAWVGALKDQIRPLASGQAAAELWRGAWKSLCADRRSGVYHLCLWKDHQEFHGRHQGYHELVHKPELRK